MDQKCLYIPSSKGEKGYMKQKQQNMPTERLHLTTIVYREGEWSPELLKKEVRDRYMYCEIPKMQSISHKQEKSSVQINSKAKSSEYADLIKDTMIQKSVDPQNLLYIAATEESLRAAQMLGLATLGYDNRSCMKHDIAKNANSFSSVRMIVEGFEEVDALFLERVYEREHHLPWEIARTDRWILREFTMDDMDGLVELYDQPGVSYRIENGKKVPGYIEPLLPREEEEEYQRCYIENMYGYFEYGMWIVTERQRYCLDRAESGQTIGNRNEAKRQQCPDEQTEVETDHAEKSRPRIIGRAGLENREYEDGVELEMGYVIDPRWQRQGIAYEVCSAIMEYAAEHTDFERLNALTEADNVASIALLEKLGFTYLEDTDVSGNMTRRYVFQL